jgi:hypothetical protein
VVVEEEVLDGAQRENGFGSIRRQKLIVVGCAVIGCDNGWWGKFL